MEDNNVLNSTNSDNCAAERRKALDRDRAKRAYRRKLAGVRCAKIYVQWSALVDWLVLSGQLSEVQAEDQKAIEMALQKFISGQTKDFFTREDKS